MELKPIFEVRHCPECKKEFISLTRNQRFCVSKCARIYAARSYQSRQLPKRHDKCARCSVAFYTRSPTKKYCSKKCRIVHSPVPRPTDLAELSTAAKGSWAELVVCTDLIRKGWFVFRAVSPVGPCDMVATKHIRTIRIQVTVAAVTGSDKLAYNNHDETKDFWDVLALVLYDGSVIYQGFDL